METKNRSTLLNRINFYSGEDTLREFYEAGDNSPLIMQHYPPREINRFEKWRLPIGWKPYEDERTIYWDKRKTIWLDFSEVMRTLIIGKTRSGKSWLMRRIMDCAIESGFSVCHLSDIKDEIKSSRFKLQTKFMKFLRNYEEPKGFDVISYRPVFFHKILKENQPEGNTSFQLSFKDISAEDMVILMRLHSEKDKVKKMLLYDCFEKSASINGLHDNIEFSNADKGTIKSVLANLELLIKSGVIGENYKSDWVKDINNGKIPVLNIKNFNDVPAEYYQVYIRVLLKKIVNACAENKIKNRILILIDEASKVIPQKKETIGKEEIMYHLDVSAQHGVYIIFATQLEKDIPENVAKQCRYILLPGTITIPDATDIVQKFVRYEHPITMKKLVTRSLKNAKDRGTGEKCWIKVDVNTRKILKFYPYAPLSFHMESKK